MYNGVVQCLADTVLSVNLMKNAMDLSPLYNVNVNDYSFCSNYEALDVDFKNTLMPLLYNFSVFQTKLYNDSVKLNERYKNNSNEKLIQIIINVVPYNTALVVGLLQSQSTFLKPFLNITKENMNYYTWQVVPLKYIPFNYFLVIKSKTMETSANLLNSFKMIIISNHKMRSRNTANIEGEETKEDKVAKA